MIVRDLRLGSKAIIRIYRNGVIIWEGGKKYTAAQLISVLTGSALVDTDYPVPIQMDAYINSKTVGKPFPADANASAYGTAELFGNVVPQPADTINSRAETKSILTAIATPLSALYIWCRGKLAMALGTKGTPQPADTVDGAGETTANLTEQASPTAQGMTKMLFSTEGELNGTATHENAEVAEQVSSYASGELALIGQPVAKTACDVTFVVNGKVEHQAVVLEGEAPSDPVADGTIGTPTQESTAQYHFHYTGWSFTEDGEVVSGGGSAETVILAEEEYSDFSYNVTHGLYCQYVSPAPFIPVIGETYTVVFDGETYICTAQDASSLVEGAIFIGNATAFGMSGNNEPFIIGGTPDSPMNIFALNDTEATEHTVAIYQVSASGGEGLPIITEDTVFYAVYDKELRYYTINFYDDETLYESKSVAYGDTPSVTAPEKDGYTFDGWSPELRVVTGDAEYHALWKEKVSFANATWEQIAEISEAGEAASYFKVGDAKTIPVTIDGVEYPHIFKIVGINHDDLADGSGKAGLSILSFTMHVEAQYCTNATTTLNPYASLAQTAVTSFKSYLPAELQSIIKTVTKTTNAWSSGTQFTKTTTKDLDMWYPTATELLGSDIGAKAGEQYAAFLSDSFGQGANAIYDVEGNRIIYGAGWLCNDSYQTKRGWFVNGTNTSISTSNANVEKYVAVGFCV